MNNEIALNIEKAIWELLKHFKNLPELECEEPAYSFILKIWKFGNFRYEKLSGKLHIIIPNCDINLTDLELTIDDLMTKGYLIMVDSYRKPFDKNQNGFIYKYLGGKPIKIISNKVNAIGLEVDIKDN